MVVPPDMSVEVTCQMCHNPLLLTGIEAGGDPLGSPPIMRGSSFASVGESFIMLEERRQAGGTAAGPSRSNMDESYLMLNGAESVFRPQRTSPGQPPLQGAQHQASAQSHPQPHTQHPHTQQPPSQTQQQQQQQQHASSSLPSSSAAPPPPPQQPTPPVQHHQQHQPQESGSAFGLDAKLQTLATLFELASTQTQVDHPLCLDCVAQLKEEIDAQVQQTEREIAAYSVAATRMEAEAVAPMDPVELERQLKELARQEEQQWTRAEALERELLLAQNDLASLHMTALDLDALEERYWHDYNDYQLQLSMHIDDRDGLLNKIDRTSQRLQLLKNTNVYNDAFKIWHDGPFGTISGFRLGRTPDVHVEWDEINAAWGQAVLLLHTMAQGCRLVFNSSRLLPMGSHPRVADKRNTYDLFGPVNKLWSANYDRAMMCFMGCLQEFGAYAKATDLAAAAELPPFEFPFAIEGDKVNGHTIKLTLNKDARWTKALKFMLADLKVALQWMVKHELAESSLTLDHLLPEGLSPPSTQGSGSREMFGV